MNGSPGGHSARYDGPNANGGENIEKLLNELASVPMNERGARFRTIIVILFPDRSIITAEGIVSGKIALTPKGKLGFGYDSVFLPEEVPGKTFGELTNSEKIELAIGERHCRGL